jgi:glutaredoxin-like YruB-family protein
MSVKKINSYQELLQGLNEDKTFVLIYKNGSEQSNCAYENIVKAAEKNSGINVMTVDVSEIRDIHQKFNVKTAPSLLVFENKEFKNLIKGCQDANYINSLFEDALYIAESKGEDRAYGSVTVYTTPTCSWCNTLKSHLRKHRVYFNEVDISRDQSAAEELVRRSGQQGVPQTDIDGQIIVGFDKTKLNRLLGINDQR